MIATATALHDAHVDARRQHHGLPVAPAELGPAQKMMFERAAGVTFILPEREVDQIVEWTIRNRNTYFLAKVLRGATDVPAKLRSLVADVLEGKPPGAKRKWKPLRASGLRPALVRIDVERAEQLLREGDPDTLLIAAELGLNTTDGRRRSTTARAIVANEYGVKPDVVRRWLFPEREAK